MYRNNASILYLRENQSVCRCHHPEPNGIMDCFVAVLLAMTGERKLKSGSIKILFFYFYLLFFLSLYKYALPVSTDMIDILLNLGFEIIE